MKFNIEGFDQANAIKFNMDGLDLIILRYFVDFKDSGKMKTRILEGKEYYWIKYPGVLLELPILNMKKDTLYKRLKNMVANGILEHTTLKEKGVYSFYRLGCNYRYLIDSNPNNDRSDLNPTGGSDLNPTPSGNKSDTLPDLNPEQTIILLKDSSIKDINIYSSVIDHLNDVVGTKYKHTSKKTQSLIKARQNEGYNLEDFIKVIDIKSKEWLNTEYSKYLRPETLFGTKFENYLNQGVKKNDSSTKNNETGKGKTGRFNNYNFS